MTGLTKEYILAHSREIHDFDSFGRAIVEAVLTEAADRAAGESEMKINGEFTITEVSAKGCVTVCAWGVCVHVNV
ncbi:hypothetical protein [Roseibium album]|uniref:hypothetical protein n=1 Tax=Roseibium album TaxID=311410 RepID=UPI002490A9A5|nr:hypothetical protein [Roseibium album]